MLYQNPDNRWTEISTDLKTTAHSDRILTHAAILPTPGTKAPDCLGCWPANVITQAAYW